MIETADASMTNMALNPRDTAGDDSLLVRFYMEATHNPAKSEEEGRPIVEDKVWIEISQPGNKLGVRRVPATDRHKARFPKHYAAFKSRISDDDEFLEGTPLTEWAGATRAQVEEMRFLNIRTVEQLAGMADVNNGAMMGLIGLKEKAKKYLATASGNAAAVQIDQMKAENAEMRAQLAELIITAKANMASGEQEQDTDVPHETKVSGEPEKKTRRRRKAA
jgi:hypothetical protein